MLTLVTNSTYNVGSPYQATVNITDNDPTTQPGVYFMTATNTAAESVTSVSIPVFLTAVPPQGDYSSAASYTNGSPSFLKVSYGVIGGTATNGVDYVLANGTLVWTNVALTTPKTNIVSELIQNIKFTVANDAAVNGNRTILVKLSNYVENVYVGPTSRSFSRPTPAPPDRIRTLTSGSAPAVRCPMVRCGPSLFGPIMKFISEACSPRSMAPMPGMWPI